jgi:vitamin B12 transporter
VLFVSNLRSFRRPLFVAGVAAGILLDMRDIARAAELSASPETLPDLVISATRTPTPAEEIGSSVTVVTGEEIEQKQQRTLPDVLREVPGLNVVQTGGPGGTSSVFMRGTNANQTKVLIDGIDVSDPSQLDGSFDFAHLLTSDIERVEVLRGPQSGLYGSDAIGGVINIITKTGRGPAQFRGSIEGGSFGTFNQFGSASGSVSRFSYAFNAAHLHVDNTPVTPLNLLPPGRQRNDDRYDNKTFSTKLGAELTDNLDVGVVARIVDTSLRFTGDDFSTSPSTPAAQQSDSDTRQIFTRGTVHFVAFDGRFDQTAGLAYTDYRRRDIGPFSPAMTNRGERIKFDWQGNTEVLPGELVTLGVESQHDAILDSPISAETNNNAGLVQLQSSLAGRLFNAATARFDANDRFGNKATWREAPALLFPETGTKLKASVGTGFRGPSLNQLFVSFPAFNFFANPNLKPEESLGYDAGFEQPLFEQRVRFGSTYFRNYIDNLIALSADGTTNVNISKATTYGFENFIFYRPWTELGLRADYTYTIAEDADLHQELLRRPKHKVSLSTQWQPTEPLSLSASVIYVGPHVDGNRDFSIQREHASGYTLVNFAGSRELGGGVAAFARVDNLLDRRYEDPTGFQRPGLGVFLGLRVAFGPGVPGTADRVRED